MDKSTIRSLLEQAARLRNTPNRAIPVSRIQVKLDEAIVGLTSPYPIDGPVAERLNDLDELYVRWVRSGQPVTDEIIDLIYELQQGSNDQ